MEFWGFEGRQTLPGDGFGLFSTQQITVADNAGHTQTVSVEVGTDNQFTPSTQVEQTALLNALGPEWAGRDFNVSQGSSVVGHKTGTTWGTGAAAATTPTTPTTTTGATTPPPQIGGGGEPTVTFRWPGGSVPVPQAQIPGMAHAAGSPVTITRDQINQAARIAGVPPGVEYSATASDGSFQPYQGNADAPAGSGPGFVGGIRQALQGATGIVTDAAGLRMAAQLAAGPGGASGYSGMGGMGVQTNGFGGFSGPGGIGVGVPGSSAFSGPGGFGFSQSGGMDLSNTGFGIGMMGGESRARSRALEGMINQLLAAIMMGNVDMIASAITLCNLKAKQTLMGASMHVVRAMQLYDRQMQQTSDRMGAIAGRGPSASGELAQANAEMNQYSMSRQALTNNLRDIMSMVEEMGNIEKSLYDVKSREAGFYRWS